MFFFIFCFGVYVVWLTTCQLNNHQTGITKFAMKIESNCTPNALWNWMLSSHWGMCPKLWVTYGGWMQLDHIFHYHDSSPLLHGHQGCIQKFEDQINGLNLPQFVPLFLFVFLWVPFAHVKTIPLQRMLDGEEWIMEGSKLYYFRATVKWGA